MILKFEQKRYVCRVFARCGFPFRFRYVVSQLSYRWFLVPRLLFRGGRRLRAVGPAVSTSWGHAPAPHTVSAVTHYGTATGTPRTPRVTRRARRLPLHRHLSVALSIAEPGGWSGIQYAVSRHCRRQCPDVETRVEVHSSHGETQQTRSTERFSQRLAPRPTTGEEPGRRETPQSLPQGSSTTNQCCPSSSPPSLSIVGPGPGCHRQRGNLSQANKTGTARTLPPSA